MQQTVKTTGGYSINLELATDLQGMPPSGRDHTGIMLAELSEAGLRTGNRERHTSGRGCLKSGFVNHEKVYQ